MMIISESTTSNVSQIGTENCGISGSENCTLENVASSYLIGTPLVISGQTPMVIGNVTSATLEHDLVPRAVLECKRAGPIAPEKRQKGSSLDSNLARAYRTLNDIHLKN